MYVTRLQLTNFRNFDRADFDLQQKSTIVQAGETVLLVELEFRSGATEDIREETNRINRLRSAGQPKGGHSSGCMFKNPEGEKAGRLIDECGLKGFAVGGARVSEAHANFVINEGAATAADILALMNEVSRRVEEKSGRRLEAEVRCWRRDGAAEVRP